MCHHGCTAFASSPHIVFVQFLLGCTMNKWVALFLHSMVWIPFRLRVFLCRVSMFPICLSVGEGFLLVLLFFSHSPKTCAFRLIGNWKWVWECSQLTCPVIFLAFALCELEIGISRPLQQDTKHVMWWVIRFQSQNKVHGGRWMHFSPVWFQSHDCVRLYWSSSELMCSAVFANSGQQSAIPKTAHMYGQAANDWFGF